MIEWENYEPFVWIEESVDNTYNKVILNPWKETTFGDITEKYVYTMIAEHFSGKEACNFLQSGCKDDAFLKESSISIVFTREECQNHDLVKVRRDKFIRYLRAIH